MYLNLTSTYSINTEDGRRLQIMLRYKRSHIDIHILHEPTQSCRPPVQQVLRSSRICP